MKNISYAGHGACEMCESVVPCATCGGTESEVKSSPLLKEVNQMLMKMMINHPSFESKKVRQLNHKVCKVLQEERDNLKS